MLMVFNTLFPVFALIALGAALKSAKITDTEFLKNSDRLIYYFFFPVMLFWKIGGSSHDGQSHISLTMIAMGTTVFAWITSLIAIRAAGISSFKAGSFSQSSFRINTYIGMAVVMNSMGDTGVRLFSILIGLTIPLINILAVCTLIWFSGESVPFKQRFKMILKAVLTNPLIAGCMAGLAYGRIFSGFPVFLDNSFRLASMAALPMALLSIGGTLSFGTIASHIRLSMLASFLKQVVLPFFGFFVLKLFGITGPALKTSMIFLALPTSTTIHVLSSQLKSDTELASASILFSTLFSLVSLSAALLI